MSNVTSVMEYKCPCCNAGLLFSGESEQLKCEYCDNTFDINTVKAFNEIQKDENEFFQGESPTQEWTERECQSMHTFVCPSCGGELITDDVTAATFCPFCDNPTVIPHRLSGGTKPDAIIPFKTTKEDAKAAFRKLCKGKPLLPSLFFEDNQIEKITGIYVPFWLYDCSGSMNGSYKATRIHTWSDARYHYTKTDHFLLKRSARAQFKGIPMDGSTKMDDIFMESIEPFDYRDIVVFDTAYLSGYYADKYDVPLENGTNRIQQRVSNSLDDQLENTFLGYASVVPAGKQLNIKQENAKYVLFPVWMLNTKYKDKIYTFAMNGQTGKITGTFPVSPKRAAVWFTGIFAAVTAITSLLQLLLF